MAHCSDFNYQTKHKTKKTQYREFIPTGSSYTYRAEIRITSKLFCHPEGILTETTLTLTNSVSKPYNKPLIAGLIVSLAS